MGSQALLWQVMPTLSAGAYPGALGRDTSGGVPCEGFFLSPSMARLLGGPYSFASLAFSASILVFVAVGNIPPSSCILLRLLLRESKDFCQFVIKLFFPYYKFIILICQRIGMQGSP